VVLDAALLGDRVAPETPGAPREPEARAGREDRHVEVAVGRVGDRDAGAAAERARDRDDQLPGRAVEHGLAVGAERAGQRRRRRGGADGADAVGERAEARLERGRAVCRHRGEPRARHVNERAAVAEAAELVGAQRGPRRGERGGGGRLERQARRAHVVVRRPAGDHAERHAEPPRQLRDRGDRAVAAGDDEPVGGGVRRPLEVRGREHLDVGVHRPHERSRIQPAAGGGVDDQRHSHFPPA
jgi:hypothetical protein